MTTGPDRKGKAPMENPDTKLKLSLELKYEPGYEGDKEGINPQLLPKKKRSYRKHLPRTNLGQSAEQFRIPTPQEWARTYEKVMNAEKFTPLLEDNDFDGGMHWDPVTGEPTIFQAETFWSLDREFQSLAMQTPLPPVWHDVAIEGGHPGITLQTIEETRITAENDILWTQDG